MPESLTLVEISKLLKDRYDIDITDRSLGRYRDEFSDTFRIWIDGKGKKRRYKPESVEAFKVVVDLKAKNEDRQTIQNVLDKEFGVVITETTDRQTTDRQQVSLLPIEDLRKFVLSIPEIIDRQEKIIEQQAELLQKQDQRITELEDRMLESAEQKARRSWWSKLWKRTPNETN